MSLELVTLNETEKKIFFQIICYTVQIIKCVDFTCSVPNLNSNLKIVVMCQTPIYLTSNKLERVNLLVIEIQLPIFGFERSNIQPNRAFTRFTKMLIEQNRTSIFQTLNKLKRVHLWIMELKHPTFCLKQSNIKVVKYPF